MEWKNGAGTAVVVLFNSCLTVRQEYCECLPLVLRAKKPPAYGKGGRGGGESSRVVAAEGEMCVKAPHRSPTFSLCAMLPAEG